MILMFFGINSIILDCSCWQPSLFLSAASVPCVSLALQLRAENRTRSNAASWCPSWWKWGQSVGRESRGRAGMEISGTDAVQWITGNCSCFLCGLPPALNWHSCAGLVIYFYQEVWTVCHFHFQFIVCSSLFKIIFFGLLLHSEERHEGTHAGEGHRSDVNLGHVHVAYVHARSAAPIVCCVW